MTGRTARLGRRCLCGTTAGLLTRLIIGGIGVATGGTAFAVGYVAFGVAGFVGGAAWHGIAETFFAGDDAPDAAPA